MADGNGVPGWVAREFQRQDGAIEGAEKRLTALEVRMENHDTQLQRAAEERADRRKAKLMIAGTLLASLLSLLSNLIR